MICGGSSIFMDQKEIVQLLVFSTKTMSMDLFYIFFLIVNIFLGKTKTNNILVHLS